MTKLCGLELYLRGSINLENSVGYTSSFLTLILYLKLLLKTMNTGGKLVFKLGDKTIPYDLNDISKFTRIDIDTVIVAMNLFLKIGLIEQSQEILTLPNSLEMTGSESDSAKRMRKLRDSKK